MRLWRLHGPTRVLSAGLYPHMDGTELRVFFEPERANEILERQVGEARSWSAAPRSCGSS
jgi:hypothetical protein